MPLVGHGLGILGLEEPPDVLPVLEVVLRAQVEVKAKLEVLEELAPARASGNELTPGGARYIYSTTFLHNNNITEGLRLSEEPALGFALATLGSSIPRDWSK